MGTYFLELPPAPSPCPCKPARGFEIRQVCKGCGSSFPVTLDQMKEIIKNADIINLIKGKEDL